MLQKLLKKSTLWFLKSLFVLGSSQAVASQQEMFVANGCRLKSKKTFKEGSFFDSLEMSPADSHLKVIAFHGKDSGLSRPALKRYTISSNSKPNKKSPGQENMGEPIKSPTMEHGGYPSGVQQTHGTVHGRKSTCYF